MGKKKRRGRELRLEVFEPERMDMPEALRCYPIRLRDLHQRVFVFVLSAEERVKLNLTQVENMARVVGDLVHPHQAAFLTVQPGAKLSVYEVRDPCHPGPHAESASTAVKAG
jgi:hypothetical protein